MGQKVNPIGLRVGVNKDWEANWFAEKKEFGTLLNKDNKIRKYLANKMKDAAVASVVIERTAKRTDVKIYTAKPGVIIGHGGEDIEKLRNEITKNNVVTKDYVFSSASTAANFVTGSSTNGMTRWKTESGKSIKEVL